MGHTLQQRHCLFGNTANFTVYLSSCGLTSSAMSFIHSTVQNDTVQLMSDCVNAGAIVTREHTASQNLYYNVLYMAVYEAVLTQSPAGWGWRHDAVVATRGEN